MGPFSTAITIGCLNAMQWLLWFVGALLVALVVTQAVRGDETADPVKLLVLAVVAAGGGWICGWASRRFAALMND